MKKLKFKVDSIAYTEDSYPNLICRLKLVISRKELPYIPTSVWKWIQKTSSLMFCTYTDAHIIHVQGTATLKEGDINDPIKAKKIAIAKAKRKLFKFLESLTQRMERALEKEYQCMKASAQYYHTLCEHQNDFIVEATQETTQEEQVQKVFIMDLESTINGQWDSSYWVFKTKEEAQKAFYLKREELKKKYPNWTSGLTGPDYLSLGAPKSYINNHLKLTITQSKYYTT